jgi:hypothetical protein
VTNQQTGQPMSRRERRALTEQSLQQGPGSFALADSYTLVQPPAAPAIPLPPPPAPPPLSRRERRQFEHGASGVASYPSTAAPMEAMGTPTPPAPPLPPVFAALASAPPITQTTTVTPFSDAVPVITPSRSVGHMTPTTNSLIVPETPTIDIAGPLGNTGEVVFTGQIRLPQSLSEVGSLPALVMDRDDYEVMDDYVTGAIPMSVMPMRASQAASGKGDDSAIVMVSSARWGTAAVVTSLGAAVLGLAAVALLILAVMTDVLG